MKTPNYVSPLDLQRMEAKARERRQVSEYLRKSTPLTRRDGRFRRDPFTGRTLEYLEEVR